jgi:hypothetical protein
LIPQFTVVAAQAHIHGEDPNDPKVLSVHKTVLSIGMDITERGITNWKRGHQDGLFAMLRRLNESVA